MLPIRDNVPSARFPTVTVGIIALNILVFLQELKVGPHLDDLMIRYAIIPAHYTRPDLAQFVAFPQQVFAIFSSMFLHGGWLHLLGNMWTLWIFGDNVEDRLGHFRYLMFYLASGAAAALLHIYTNAGSLMPTIGASGAIAGIMGGYFRFYPSARIETLIPPFFFGPVFVLPAVVFLGWWFLLQFCNGFLSLGVRDAGFSGIAWWAHVGGFTFGLLVCLLVQRKPSRAARFIEF